MTRATIELQGGDLHIRCATVKALERGDRRPFEAADRQRCRQWTDGYRHALGAPDQAKSLPAIGREIYD